MENEMEEDKIFLVELKQSEIEGIVSALDTVVKSHGLNVAEKCSEIHRSLINAQLKGEELLEEVDEHIEEISLEEVEDELEQIIEVPKKRKKTTRRKK